VAQVGEGDALLPDLLVVVVQDQMHLVRLRGNLHAREVNASSREFLDLILDQPALGVSLRMVIVDSVVLFAVARSICQEDCKL
jgi:hypothetical protein